LLANVDVAATVYSCARWSVNVLPPFTDMRNGEPSCGEADAEKLDVIWETLERRKEREGDGDKQTPAFACDGRTLSAF
jgi:hypothetical protein